MVLETQAKKHLCDMTLPRDQTHGKGGHAVRRGRFHAEARRARGAAEGPWTL